MFEAQSKTLFSGKVLIILGLLWRANVYPLNLDCAARRAMTGPERESAVRLFVLSDSLPRFSDSLTSSQTITILNAKDRNGPF